MRVATCPVKPMVARRFQNLAGSKTLTKRSIVNDTRPLAIGAMAEPLRDFRGGLPVGRPLNKW